MDEPAESWLLLSLHPFPNQAVHIIAAPVVGFVFTDVVQAVAAADLNQSKMVRLSQAR